MRYFLIDFMSALLRPTNLLLLATYLLLSFAPFFGLPMARPLSQIGMSLLAAALGWIGLWAVCKRPAYFHWLLLPAFLAIPVEMYLQVYFHQSISTHHLGLIAETSPREALEFLGNKVWALGALAIVLSAWWIVTFRIAWRTRELDWNGWSRWLTLAIMIVTLAGVEYGAYAGFAPAASTAVAHPAPPVVTAALATRMPPLPHWMKVSALDSFDFTEAWPFGIALHGYHFFKERQYLSRLADVSRAFRFGAHSDPAKDEVQTIVMVIGESSRYDRWSLNGYARQTTPLLQAETNVMSLTNVVTPVSATRLSVPVMVSRKPATDSLRAEFNEKSFVSAFKEAGFKTYWLSNQMSFGQFDTPVSVYAKEADVTAFLNVGGMSSGSDFDQVLLMPLQKAVSDPARKKLIVLHSLGSHWNYSHRYPPAFDRWKPSLMGVDKPAFTDVKIKPQLDNSYDNSILYTDWFLSEVVRELKASDAVTAMMYAADHGQTLYDGTCQLAFHGHNTQFEFHVPALVWYSDRYQATYPDKVAQLLRNRRAKLTTENVFDSLLDMADIHYPTERPDYSFFNRRFRPHKRYVDSYGWSNYDNASFKGDCREVIDKGTPLVQKK